MNEQRDENVDTAAGGIILGAIASSIVALIGVLFFLGLLLALL
jgi:hypothetical protein